MELVEGQSVIAAHGSSHSEGFGKRQTEMYSGVQTSGQHQLVSHFIEHAQESPRALTWKPEGSTGTLRLLLYVSWRGKVEQKRQK